MPSAFLPPADALDAWHDEYMAHSLIVATRPRRIVCRRDPTVVGVPVSVLVACMVPDDLGPLLSQKPHRSMTCLQTRPPEIWDALAASPYGRVGITFFGKVELLICSLEAYQQLRLSVHKTTPNDEKAPS